MSKRRQNQDTEENTERKECMDARKECDENEVGSR